MDASATATAEVVAKIHEIARREAAEIAARWPTVLRRVQGYNLDMVQPDRPHNLAHLLVGSEGTLGYFRRLRLKLSRIPKHKVLGICHFPSFYRAMDVTRHIVALNPDAVELVDSTMIGLARDNAAFRPIVERFLRGQPEAILLVEFAGDELAPLEQKLQELAGLIGDLGLPESVVQITDARLQRDVWEVRKAGLNIMMSMKGDGKPVSFIEDCAVPLEHLAEYTDKLTRVFEKHGTRGTWYAHASVGTLHVRPVLNMKTDGAKKMRAIAEEACALVRQYKGSAFSGEHGDGLVRSEWIEPILGERLTRAIAEIKDLLDPKGLMNPGKIVRPTRMDDRSLFRYQPGYHTLPVDTALDWSEWGGFPQAVEMCNNNGHCRKFDAGTMCPSFRVTGDEQHLTRGRANTLRLALSGQLGTEALTSDAMLDALDLCVSCKGCRRECPTGVDMARMKIEVLHQINRHRRPSLRQKAIAYLPRYAPVAARMPGLMNLRDRSRILAGLTEKLIGLSARRTLPKWRRDTFLTTAKVPATLTHTGEVVLFADTFNNYFESANLHAASDVLRAAGYDVHLAQPLDGRRPLCCGRTFLAAGMVGQARAEQRRLLEALAPYLTRDLVVLGLEPSCLLTMRDEMQVLWPAATLGDLPRRAMMFEEFIAREREAGRWKLDLAALSDTRVLLHGHCHQKAFGVMPAVEKVLRLVPGLEVETIASSCCGMAGAFGYESEHYDLSLKMGEAGLLPAVRDASGNTLIVADGVSCRHQILDGAGREALHVARVLQAALAGSVTASP